MQGLMQDDWTLVVPKIIDYAAKVHGNQVIISRCVEDPNRTIEKRYKEIRNQAALCTLALRRLGVVAGDRVGTLAWNTIRHFECWYGIAGAGAVCHTLNPRLFDKELEYIINHAEDGIIFADITFVDLLDRLMPKLPTVRHIVFLTDRVHMPQCPGLQSQVNVLCYDDLLAAEMDGLQGFTWNECTETQACGLCYTSGTTGNPKGVLYSHRSNFLLAMSACIPDALDVKSNSCFLLVVPMFHANAWGITFAAPFVGARLVLPGPYLDGANIHRMMEDFGATHTAGVPTVWAGLMEHLNSVPGSRLSTLKVMVVGGAPCPRHSIEYFEDNFGVEVRHMWGMTELSPFGTLGAVKGTVVANGADRESIIKFKLKQGWPLVFVDMRIVDDSGKELPRDGKTFGNLQVRGPHTLKTYYRAERPAVDADNWFDTGDVATIDEEGCMQITDRAKDVIKSGGEWISSIEIENLAAGHPKVVEAAVIGIPNEKWGERPLLVIVPRKEGVDRPVTKEEMLGHLKGKIATWWMPDDVVFVESIPHTAVGKISKLQLRQQLKHYRGPRSSKL